MPVKAAINGSGENIYPGAALCGVTSRLRFDRVRLAGDTVLAGAVARDGARNGGVLTLETNGIVDLPNWSLACGAKYLTDGATYYLGSGGQLTTSGTQIIGHALSRTELLVTLGLVNETAESVANAAQAALYDHIADSAAHRSVYERVGSRLLEQDTDTGSVTDLNLPWTPHHCWLSVEIPAGGLKIFPNIVGSPSAAGFNYTLNGLPDNPSYVLHYLLKP